MRNETYKQRTSEAQERLKAWHEDMHPCLLPSFYETIDYPEDKQEAEMLSKCHKDAVNDIDLQIETVELDMEMNRIQADGTDPGSEMYRTMMEALWNLQDKKRRLLFAKRRHSSAANAYWYYCQ